MRAGHVHLRLRLPERSERVSGRFDDGTSRGQKLVNFGRFELVKTHLRRSGHRRRGAERLLGCDVLHERLHRLTAFENGDRLLGSGGRQFLGFCRRSDWSRSFAKQQIAALHTFGKSLRKSHGRFSARNAAVSAAKIYLSTSHVTTIKSSPKTFLQYGRTPLNSRPYFQGQAAR